MGAMIPSFDKCDPVADLVAALGENGAAIVRNLVSAGIMDMLLSKLEPAFEELAPAEDAFTGYGNKALGRVLTRGIEFSQHLLLNPLFLEVADAILLP